MEQVLNGQVQVQADAVQAVRCDVCGRMGAKWLMQTAGKDFPVHKPCGNLASAKAPKGTIVKIRPSEALREEWRQKDAENFWKQKFLQAETNKREKNAPALSGQAGTTPA